MRIVVGGGGGGVNPRPQTPQRQPLTESETPLKDILVWDIHTIQGRYVASSSFWYS